MSHRVRTKSAVRDFQRKFKTDELCNDNDLVGTYHFAISRTIDGWIGDLDHEKIDTLVLLALTEALKDAIWIEEHVVQHFSLPTGWTADENNWDLYRKAIAVSVLQSYYDALP